MKTDKKIMRETGNEIVKQLGNKALFMMGVKKNIMLIDNGISFKIRGSRKGNYLTITLNAMDTYDISLHRVSIKGIKEVKRVDGVYNDQMRSIIEKITGLYLSL